MTSRFSTSADTSAFTNPFASVGLAFSPSASLLPFTSASLLSFASAGFVSLPSICLILFLSAGPLIPVVQDMIKPFYIRKPVIGADNTISLIYTKKTLWIGGVSFLFLDNAWQSMLTILNKLQRLEIVEDVTYQ